MSNPRVDPHPDKWITAPKVPKPATQRPLVSSSFRAHNGIATPPTTTRKGASNSAGSASGSTSRKRRAPEVTPTAPPGTRGILSFLTPPTSNTQPSRKQRGPSRLQNATHLHQSPTRRSPRLNRDREREARGRSVLLEEWRTSVRSPAKRSASPDFEILEAPATPERAPPTSGPSMTPVPSSVMATHKKVCGQDSERRRQVASPWRKRPETDEARAAARGERDAARQEAGTQRENQRERKRIRLDVKETVDENAKKRVHEAKQKRALGDFQSLAQLSSDLSSSPRSSSPSERVPLATKNANALRRHSSAVVEPVCPRDSKWPQRQPALRTPAIPSAFPARSQTIPSAFPARLRTTPVESSQPSSSAKPPSPSTTPRARRVAHHRVTPPKSRTPQRKDQQETLFEFPPAPPRQPIFKPVSPKPITDWCPVDMQAETLMTWSMGGGAATLGAATLGPASSSQSPEESAAPLVGLRPIDEDDEDDEDDEVFFPKLVGSGSSPARPPGEPFPLSSPADPIGEFDDADLREPSSPSPQRIRQLVHPPSSPPRLSFGPASPIAKRPSKSPTKLVRHSKQDIEKRRKAMDHAIFSSLSETSQARPVPRAAPFPFPRPTQNRKTPPRAKSKSRTPPPRKSQGKKSASSASQSKLEAFGYSRSSARAPREFDTSFSDEEDLDFGDDDGPALRPAAGGSELRPVPSAPPHPSLRPMGVREQTRREAVAMERHRGQRERDSLHSSDRSSSLPPPPSAITEGSSSQSDERLEAQISESTRQWWEGLAHDHSSDV